MSSTTMSLVRKRGSLFRNWLTSDVLERDREREECSRTPDW